MALQHATILHSLTFYSCNIFQIIMHSDDALEKSQHEWVKPCAAAG